LRLEELGQLKKSNDLIGNRNRDFPACSTVLQPTTLPCAPFYFMYYYFYFFGIKAKNQKVNNNVTPLHSLSSGCPGENLGQMDLFQGH
jgi:hypothetical protein